MLNHRRISDSSGIYLHFLISSKMNPTRCESPFLIDLPSEIIISILSRLPIRTIISCKCVCKQFLNLLSAPEFVTFHLSLSNPGLLIRQFGVKDDICQIIEFEDEFDLQHHNLRDNGVMTFDPSLLFGFSDFLLSIIDSVNGIICLHGQETKKRDALYLCNPITREYMALPRIEGIDDCPCSTDYGFGVSRISGQYKVVGNVHRRSHDHQAALHSTTQYHECLVYTLGTSSWRIVQRGKLFGPSHNYFNLFLNGNLHGLQECENSYLMSISCFDLESESFKPFPPPPPPPPTDLPANGALRILDDCLCFIDYSFRDTSRVIWVMKEYGMMESWAKLFVIPGSQDFVDFYYRIYPIKTFKDRDILVNFTDEKLACYCYKTKTFKWLDFVIQNRYDATEAITHSSSFLSLKSFDGENVELL